MQFTVNLTISDLFKFNIWLLYFSTFYRKMNLFMVLIMSVYALYSWAAFHNPQIAYVLVMPGIFWVLLPLLVCLSIRKSYSENPDLYQIHYTVDKAGISGESARFTFHDQWALFGQMRETKNYFLLPITKRQFRVIPKRFLNEEQITRFREFSQQT